MSYSFTRIAVICVLLCTTLQATAQDIMFTPFNTAPPYVNPAFTGMFDGRLRVSGVYKNNWNEDSYGPYTVIGLGFDMPVATGSSGNYLAAGLQMVKTVAADGSEAYFQALASVAYHKVINKKSDLSFGIQGGYAQKSIDLARIYFNQPFPNGVSTQYHLGVGSDVSYYLVNAGVSFSRCPSSRFNYTLGVSAFNLNRPNEQFEKKPNGQDNRTDISFSAIAGANWLVTNRFALRPAFLYLITDNNFFAGSEFAYALGNSAHASFFKNVFIGAWYRSGEEYTFTAGTEFSRSIRLAIGGDFRSTNQKNDGVELQLQYLLPQRASAKHRRVVLCTRF